MGYKYHVVTSAPPGTRLGIWRGSDWLELSSLIKNENGFERNVCIKGFSTWREANERWEERLANEDGLSARVQAQQNGGDNNNVVPSSPRSFDRNNTRNVHHSPRSYDIKNPPSAHPQNRSGNGNGHGSGNSMRDLRSQHSYPSPSPSVVSQTLPAKASGRSAARAIQRASTTPANSEPRATLDTSYSARSISERTRSWAAQTNPASANRREVRQEGRENALPNAFSRGVNRSPRRQGTTNSDRGSNQVRPRASVESLSSAITVSSDSSFVLVRSISMASPQRASTSRSTSIRQVPPLITHQQSGDNSPRHTSVVVNSDAKYPLSSPRTVSVRTRGSSAPSTPSSVSSRDTHDVPPTVSSPSRVSVRSSRRTDAAEGLQEPPIVNLAPSTSLSRNLGSTPVTISRGVQTIECSEPNDGQCRHHCKTSPRFTARSSTLSDIGLSEPPHMISLVIMDPRSPVASGSTLVPAQVGGHATFGRPSPRPENSVLFCD